MARHPFICYEIFGTRNCSLCMQERLMIAELSRKSSIKLMNSCSEIYGTCKHLPRFPRFPSSTDDPTLERVKNPISRIKKTSSKIKKVFNVGLRISPRLKYYLNILVHPLVYLNPGNPTTKLVSLFFLLILKWQFNGWSKFKNQF